MACTQIAGIPNFICCPPRGCANGYGVVVCRQPGGAYHSVLETHAGTPGIPGATYKRRFFLTATRFCGNNRTFPLTININRWDYSRSADQPRSAFPYGQCLEYDSA